MTLKAIREEIDKKDDAIIKLLEERFQLVHDLKKYKNSLTDKEREEKILQKTPSEYVQDVYVTIFENSKKILKRVSKKE